MPKMKVCITNCENTLDSWAKHEETEEEKKVYTRRSERIIALL
jgi:hypothetical protein